MRPRTTAELATSLYGDTGRAYVTAPAYTVTSLGCVPVAVVAYGRCRQSVAEGDSLDRRVPDTHDRRRPSRVPSSRHDPGRRRGRMGPGVGRSVGASSYGVYRGVVRVASVAQPTVTLGAAQLRLNVRVHRSTLPTLPVMISSRDA